MISTKTIAFSMILISSSAIFAEEAIFSGPMGDKWSSQTVVTIPEGVLELNEDTYIKVDRLDFKGKIITNGHAFSVDAQVVNMLPGAQIVAYRTAANELAGPNNSNAETVGGGGLPGVTGLRGIDGIPGLSGKMNPSAISILSGPLFGSLDINANGQQGGPGQPGGKGGKGSKGKNAIAGRCEAFCVGGDRYHAGASGGNGGLGGLGGKGGRGGVGGAPVPVLTATSSAQPAISAKPGLGGAGGAPGVNGDSGPGGDAGAGIPRKVSCAIGTTHCVGESYGGGSSPQRNESAQSFESRKGRDGQILSQSFNLPKVIELSSLINKKSNVIESAYIFHWERLYYYTMLQTLQYIANREEEIGSFEDLQNGNYISLLDDDNRTTEINIIKKKWEQYFINSINKNTEMNETTKKYYLSMASNFTAILDSIITADKEKIKNQVTELRKSSELMLKKALKKAGQNCQVFMNEQEEIYLKNDLVLSDYFTIPLCTKEELKKLTLQNFKAPIILGIEPKAFIKGVNLPIVIGQKETKVEGKFLNNKNNSDVDVIIIGNTKYDMTDFQNAKNINKASLLEGKKILGLELNSKKFENVEDFTIKLKLLIRGVKI